MTYADTQNLSGNCSHCANADVDPYSLSQEQLRILKDYSLEQAELEERQASAKTAQSLNKANSASAKRV